MMTSGLHRVFALAGLLLALSACASTGDKAADRASVQRMRTETLANLFAVQPTAQERVRQSSGFAVFSNVGVNLVLLSAGGGYGVVRDNATGKDIYMNMASGGVGLGLGVKDFRGVFVFTDRKAMHWFTDKGLDLSGQADAAAKAGDKGGAWAGAVDVAPGIKLYQLTEHGLVLQATVQGTKYWKDSELN
jgi:lipid-binding SYLF domain-containing protein